MSSKSEKDDKMEDEIEFSWGKKKGRGAGSKDVQFYESFRFDGVEYSLYDSVYLFKEGETEPYIGKILKIWERAQMDRKVKVLWFFRPSEISTYLQGNEDVLENELFLGTGVGTGLTNVNHLEAIAGKCNVVCISRDDRNRQPSVEELEMAHYVFYRSFDVQNLTISDKLGEKIAMVDAKFLLNKNDHQPVELAKFDGANVAADAAETLISSEDTLVADRSVDHNTVIAPSQVKDDKVTKDLLNLSQCHTQRILDTVVSDNTVMVVGVEEKLKSSEVTLQVDGDVNCDAGLGADGKQSREKVDASELDNASVVLPASKKLLGSDQKIALKSPDAKQNGSNSVAIGAVTVPGIDNTKLELMNDGKKRIVAGASVQSEDRPSKKLRRDGSARTSIGNGGAGTQKPVSVSLASNKASQPLGTAAKTNDGGKLPRHSAVVSDTQGKQKLNGMTEDKSNDKLDKTSVKQSKELQNSVNKASQHLGGVGVSTDRGNFSSERGGTSEGLSKKSKTNNLVVRKPIDKQCKVSTKQSTKEEIGASSGVKEITQPLDSNRWFTPSPWEDRMKEAYDQERLVLLQNLDPTYIESDVKDIILRGFQESCEAKILPRTATSNPYCGQAFAIFKTREVAQKVIRKLEQDSLLLPNGRPLVGTIGIINLPGKQPQYFGHIVIPKCKQQKQREAAKRDAVSTSHAAQTNTIEFEMALEWRLLQDRSDLIWKSLYQKQGEEMRKLKATLKSK